MPLARQAMWLFLGIANAQHDHDHDHDHNHDHRPDNNVFFLETDLAR
jgi:hypothetical protein